MYWSGMPAIEVPPGNADYEITYHPITMTHDEPHRGTLFFPLPDGSALVYNLTGVSKPPKPADTIVQEVKAKIA